MSAQTQAASTKSVLLPDLTFTPKSLATAPPTPRAGSSEVRSVFFQAEVCNQGDATANNFTVSFVCSRGETYHNILVTKRIARLAAKGKMAISEPVFATSLPPAGAYRLQAFVDTYPASVAESDERNNQAEIALTIIGPEFAVSSSDIELSPASPRAGQPFSARVPVRNNGTDRGYAAVSIRLLDASGRLRQETTGAAWIEAGGFAFVGGALTLPAGSGSYVVRFEVDKSGRVPEPNEDDNRAEKFFSTSPF